MKKGSGTLHFKVDWPALSKEIAQHTEIRSSPGTLMGMEILNKALYQIGKIAVHRNDLELLTILENIGVVKAAEV